MRQKGESMEREEKIQKLCLKMNVSEQEADAALRACGEDILDAALYLEALGRVRTPSGGYYRETPNMERAPQPEPQRHASESFGEAVRRFFRWLLDMMKKGMHNYLEVRKNGETSFRIPLTVFVILLCTPCLPVVLILLVVGLFFDFGYHFSGPNVKENGVCNKAAAGCVNVARDIKQSFASNDDAAYSNERAPYTQNPKSSDGFDANDGFDGNNGGCC